MALPPNRRVQDRDGFRVELAVGICHIEGGLDVREGDDHWEQARQVSGH